MSSAKDLEKMTVAELKESLTAKNLQTDGKKAVLVQRLSEYLQKAEEDAILNASVDADPSAATTADSLNADDLLGDNDEKTNENKSTSENGGTKTEEEKAKTKADEESKEAKLKRAQRLGLPIGDSTSTDAKLKRAERFGIEIKPTSDVAKAKRAERFGMEVSSPNTPKLSDEKKEKLLQRAQRFGIPVSADGKTIASAAKNSTPADVLAKRAARFSITDDATEAAKKARLERFGAAN